MKHEFVVQKDNDVSPPDFVISVSDSLKLISQSERALSPPGLMKTMLISHKWLTDGSYVMSMFPLTRCRYEAIQ